MAGRFGLLAFAMLALALAASANRAILSVQGGAKYDLGDVQLMHRRLMADLKLAQEKAGIHVNDAHLFERPLERTGRRLQQAELGSLFSNPAIFGGLLSLLGGGSNVGAFPGAALNLPGGSPFGYAPTDDSYCLFATQPYTGAPAPAQLNPGSPLPSASDLPGAFACVEASSNPPPSADSFVVSYGGQQFVCQGTPGLAPAPTTGRKLQQAPSPADIAIGQALSSIGLPLWHCVVATTPTGNTTLGEAAEAILNDLGVLAEHLLVYLNANGELSYEENVKNNFVSLANPLYPDGPRFNFSVDFASVAKDVPLLEEIFRQPAPPSPPTVSVSPPGQSTTVATTGPAGSSTQSSAAPNSSGNSSGTASNGGNSYDSKTVATTAASSVQTPEGAVIVAVPALAPLKAIATLSAFDGYLDNCQTVIGSPPHADGNFDRTNSFSTVITDGVSNMTVDTANQFAGQVAYVIPASKAVQYTPLTLATRKSAQFCYDIATLQPTYNPLATFITANTTGMAASPASTVAAFGQAYGLTSDALAQGLCISLPAGQTLQTYDALAAAVNGSGQGLSVLKTNVQLANIVTSGANLLTNDTTTYASYAIIMDQSIAKKVQYSLPTGGRKLLQASSAPSSSAPACAVDLTNATTVTSIITIAQQSAPAQPDEATRAALIQSLTPAQIAAVGAAVAALNAAVGSAPDATTAETGQYYAETKLAPQINQLATGAITLDNFTSLTSADAINQAISAAKLPGELVPTAVASPPTTVLPSTQSSTTSTSGSGLSTGGTVALATVLPIVGVIAIVAAIAFYISRKNRNAAVESPNNSAVWWRRPFARSSGSASPIAGSSSSV